MLGRSGGIGIRAGLKNRSSYEVEGSTPSFGIFFVGGGHLLRCRLVRLCDVIFITPPRSLVHALHPGHFEENFRLN